MDSLIAAIDQGTTSSRCIVFDGRGEIVSVAQREHRQIHPRPGWVEHDAAEIRDRVLAVTREAIDAAGGPARVAGLGVTNQRETVVIWDRTSGEPLTPAVVWQDTRTRAHCDELGADGGTAWWRERTGLPPATYFSGPKLRWLLEHVPGLRGRAARGEVLAGTMESWIIWNLTGEHVTDVTNASRTMLMDLRTRTWDDEACARLDVPAIILPRIVPSADAEAYGRTREHGIPVTAALGDQQAALVGQCCFEPGDAKCTYGTGAFLLLNTGPDPVASNHGLLTTVAFSLPGIGVRYALEGSVAVAGSLIQWLRDNLGIIAGSGEVEALARSVPDTGDVFIVPAFAGLFAPRWRNDARGTIVGLTGHTTRAHLARAALEATAHQVREVLDAMRADADLALPALRVDGGMVVNDLLMQTQADLLGIPCVRPAVHETTALGAALAAGLGLDATGDLDAARARWHESMRWTPGIDEATRDARHARWMDAVERSLGWVR